MKAPTRRILTLSDRGLIEPSEDRSLPLVAYDVLLPCRRFRIDHKVAVLGRVSLTAEFLLRLIRSLEGLAEEHAAAFFGFDRREMSYVLGEIQELGFVDRRDGRLWLTAQGRSLFREDSPHPEIFEVEKREERVGFDLLSLAPQQSRGLIRFERRLPELQPSDTYRVSQAAGSIPSAFRRFYAELGLRRDQSQAVKRALYSVDRVLPEDRFQATVGMLLVSTALHPTRTEINIDDWRPPHEQDDRPEILTALSGFRDGLLTSKTPDDRDAYRCLLDFAPEFLRDFARSDGLAVERYYREALARAGEPRSDRPTVPFLGSLLLPQNVLKLTEILAYGLRATSYRPKDLLWTAPQVPYWGATNVLPELLRQLSRAIGHAAGDRDGKIEGTNCLVAGKEGGYLDEAFAQVVRTEAPVLPRRLEVLLVPSILAAACVHAPIGEASGIPVALGFISFDPRVVARTSGFLLDRCDRTMPHKVLAALGRGPAGESESLFD